MAFVTQEDKPMTKAELKKMEKEAFAEMKKLKDEVTTTLTTALKLLTLTLTPTLTRRRPLPRRPRSRSPCQGSSTSERRAGRDLGGRTWCESRATPRSETCGGRHPHCIATRFPMYHKQESFQSARDPVIYTPCKLVRTRSEASTPLATVCAAATLRLASPQWASPTACSTSAMLRE